MLGKSGRVVIRLTPPDRLLTRAEWHWVGGSEFTFERSENASSIRQLAERTVH